MYQKIILVLGLSLSFNLFYMMNSYAAGSHDDIEEIVVKSSPLHKSQSDIAQFASVLQGERLREQVASSLGETLSGELGVFSSSFGPNVGRPIIRGQGGERVRILQDGIGTLDVSTISPDHAVSIEPILAERIEVIRGPNTLVYGSGAIGGVVNVIDGRIAEQLPEQLEGAFEQRHSNVSDENVSVIKLKGAVGSVAAYLDAMYRESNNTEIDGFAVRETEHDEGEHDEDEHDEEEHEDEDRGARGFVENSDSRVKAASFGLSWINGDSFIGFAVNHLENNYGIPPGAHEHHEDEEDHDAGEEEAEPEFIRVDMEQTRYELKGRWANPFSGFEKFSAKLAYNDYEHVELEGSEVGTMFDNEALEGRLELTHADWNGVHGVFGVQWLDREFSAVGEEAYVPPSETRSYGLFLVQDYHHNEWAYEWGIRYENQDSKGRGFRSRSHDLLSLSASAIWNFSSSAGLSVVVSRAQRAPAIEELFANGFHAATNTFEVGDPGLDRETAHNLELSLRGRGGPFEGTISAYYNRIDDFIFERATGEQFDAESEAIVPVCISDECVDLFQFSQEDATFRGVEAELKWDVAKIAEQPLQARLFTDYVRAKLDKGGDVPRVPPWRYGIELRQQGHSWDAYLRTSVADDQNRAGDNETETDGFTDLSLGANFHFEGNRIQHTLFFRATNLLDEEIRNATSFLRDIAPQPGRALIIGYRAEL